VSNTPSPPIYNTPSVTNTPLVKNISKEGMTVFLSSHLLFEVEQICDHVTIINKGSLLASDTLQNISSKLGPAMMHIELADLSNAVIASVKRLPFVSGTWKTGNTLLIQVTTYDDVRAQVSKEVTGAGGVIVGMSQKTSNLEDVFIQLVSKDKGEKSR
jgi:ABC-2 type transport system ATP-binding protein